MSFSFSSQSTKEKVFDAIEKHLATQGLGISDSDPTRPWGGFFVIEEKDADKFISIYFPDQDISRDKKLSPKILIVAPNKRLSWQYHHRRAELWKLVGGLAGVVRSDDDHEKETIHLKKGETIQLEQGERHRLIGLDEWGVVAEIWQHTDKERPSDENDIVRLQDDFGR